MKKLFLTAVMAIVMATPVHAACEGGTEYTVDGNTFCISNIKLNWWSAANWCKANGRHLATMYEVCPDWDGNTGSGKCSWITSSIDEDVMTATANRDNSVFGIVPSKGGVYSYFRDYTYRVFCR